MQKLLIPSIVENCLQTHIFPDLLMGRKDFDLPHTKAVVYWTKYMLNVLAFDKLDPYILITAAYAHDWGYIGLFDGINSSNPAEINKRKQEHMIKGALKISDLLHTKLPKYFSSIQIERISHLVSVHDKVEQLSQEDEILIMECDTLGMLDTDRVKPTFSKTDNEIFIKEQIYGRRLPHFIHPYAKNIALQLTAKRRSFYD